MFLRAGELRDLAGGDRVLGASLDNQLLGAACSRAWDSRDPRHTWLISSAQWRFPVQWQGEYSPLRWCPCGHPETAGACALPSQL